MKETVEEIRARLARDENVLYAIQQRAYEIWVLRGRQHGRSEEDWRLAENEVLSFLIEQELRKPAEVVALPEDVVEVTEIEIIETAIVSTPADISPEPIPEADIIIPAGMESAGGVEAVQKVEVEPAGDETKPRKRATARTTKSLAGTGDKPAAPRKPRAAKTSDDKPAAAKKTTARKETTPRKPSTKKSAKSEQPTAK